MNQSISGTCCLLLLLLLAAAAASTATCNARKQQKEKLKTLLPDDVVVEAKYVMRSSDSGLYRFTVEQLWPTHNASLTNSDRIAVRDPSGRHCFPATLKKQHPYFLIISPASAPGEFHAVAPPVLTTARSGRRHQQAVLRHLCAACPMRVIMPAAVKVYDGTITMLPCRVQSQHQVTRVQWLKDGADADTELHKMLHIWVTATDDPTYSYVLLEHADARHHDGVYTCRARDANGDVRQAQARVEVVSLGPAREEVCPEDGYCLNGGTCWRQRGTELRHCECRDGFDGERCDGAAVTLETVHDAPERDGVQVAQLTYTVVVLSLAFLCVLAAGAVYTARLRRRLLAVKGGGGGDDDDVIGDKRMTSSDGGRTLLTVTCGDDERSPTTSTHSSHLMTSSSPHSRTSSVVAATLMTSQSQRHSRDRLGADSGLR